MLLAALATLCVLWVYRLCVQMKAAKSAFILCVCTPLPQPQRPILCICTPLPQPQTYFVTQVLEKLELYYDCILIGQFT